jgi:hypothetical protein
LLGQPSADALKTGEENTTKKVAETMTKNIATCRISDSVNRAAQIMWERRLRSAVDRRPLVMTAFAELRGHRRRG